MATLDRLEIIDLGCRRKKQKNMYFGGGEGFQLLHALVFLIVGQ
jgi:hypothetical protein